VDHCYGGWVSCSCQKKENFNYPNGHLYRAFELHASQILKDKRGAVIGSENPWAEAMLLEYGAKHITTIEFGTIQSEHPNIDTYTPDDFKLGFLTGQIEPYDFVFSFSSLEHDGLGRYGDVLNPDGDLLTVARLRQVDSFCLVCRVVWILCFGTRIEGMGRFGWPSCWLGGTWWIL